MLLSAAANSYELSPIAATIIGVCVVCAGVLLLVLGELLSILVEKPSSKSSEMSYAAAPSVAG
jgi:hypothetical protein